MNYAQVIDTMFRLTVAMAVGFGLNRAKVLTSETNRSLSGMIINVTCPALVVYSVCNQKALSPEVVKLLLFGAGLYVVLPFIGMALTRLMRVRDERRGVYQLLLVFGNVTFMGFPVVQAIYGEQAIFYMNILNILFSVLIFTYGVALLKEGGPGAGFELRWRDVLSPGALAGFLSLAIYFFHISVPCMIAEFPLRALFSQGKLFLLSGLKLLLFPLLGYLAANLVFQDPMLAGVVTVSLGMPSASLCAMVCRRYGDEAQADTAALGVFLTTVLSVVTIPLVILLLSKA